MEEKRTRHDRSPSPAEPAPRPRPREYQPPRIVKKRAVSRATLFSGSGPDTGGVISGGG